MLVSAKPLPATPFRRPLATDRSFARTSAGSGFAPSSGAAILPNLKNVAAERAPQPQESAEIIYLLIPHTAQPVRTPSLFDRVAYGMWAMKESETYGRLGATVQATLGAVGFAVLGCVGLYGLYYLKSILGIDLFPDLHLEDFVPIPGYHRW